MSDQDYDDRNRLTVEVPCNGFSDEDLDRLRNPIASKCTIIQKALGLYDLPNAENALNVEATEEALRFPWFILSGLDGEADAYTNFICALIAMARKLKRITATERDTPNDKLTMRLFLVRLDAA